MAFNNNNGPAEILSDSSNFAIFVVAPGAFTDKANLPSGVEGYLSYVQNLEYLALNVGGSNWRTFQTRPMDYKNEVILEQGTVGGGYNGTSVFQAITKIHYASDAPLQLLPTLPFASRYGSQHSTYLYGYYHQGGSTNGTVTTSGVACKQDWATFTVTSIPARANCIGEGATSIQPGPKQQNTIGVINIGTDGCYLNFATDAWAAGYALPVTSSSGGNSAFGATYGYTNNTGPGWSNVYKLNWATLTWSATSSGSGSFGTWGRALNTKFNKWFQGGPTSAINRYNNSSDTFASVAPNPSGAFQEQETLMGQDWGYWSGYNGNYSTTVFKTDYAAEITSVVQRGSFNYNHSSGMGCWGPIP